MSVIVPFLGTPREAAELLAALAALRTRPDDELIVVDNGSEPRVETPALVGSGVRDRGHAGVRVVRAPRVRSSYHARNAGAETAASGWLLFLDADCRPRPTLLDDYFSEPLPERCGIVAGEVVAAEGQSSLAARHARSRRHLSVEPHLRLGPHPAGVTANLLVRRATWDELGGFHEVRSGADLEFCWRAGELGWALAYRPAALVEHVHAETVRRMLRKARGYGPGQLWAARRYPSFSAPPRLARRLGRALAGVPVWLLALRFERSALKALDGAFAIAYAWGYWLGDNRPARDRPAAPAAGPVMAAAELPAATESAGVRAGRAVATLAVAIRRPLAVDRSGLDDPPALYVEDQPPPERALALAWLWLRHPLRAWRSARARRRDGGPTGARLRELAPLARALAGTRELLADPADERGTETARGLAALLGARLRPPR